MQTTAHMLERGSNKNYRQAYLQPNFNEIRTAVSLHNFLIVLSSGRITYLICHLDDTYWMKTKRPLHVFRMNVDALVQNQGSG